MMHNYEQATIDYLKSEPRKIANRLIDFEMENDYSQQEAAYILKVDFNDLLKVEFNLPNTSADLYKTIDRALDSLLSNHDQLTYTYEAKSFFGNWDGVDTKMMGFDTAAAVIDAFKSNFKIDKFKENRNEYFGKIEAEGVICHD